MMHFIHIFVLLIVVNNFMIQCISDHPLILLISLDGFGYKFLKPDLVPNIWKLAKNGVYAPRGINAQVTTVTTPNHHSIATGLYEESHGIIDNFFYDPIFQEYFDNWNLTENDSRCRKSYLKKWYENGGQPIWRTNMQIEGHLSASYNWPVANAEYIEDGHPPHKAVFSNKSFGNKNFTIWTNEIDHVIDWFLDPVQPINFAMYYNGEPDYTEHRNDIDGEKVKEAVQNMDQLIGYIIQRLNDTDLLDKINLILTADHGHASVPNESYAINIYKYVDKSLVIHSGQSFFPRVELGVTADNVYANLSKALNDGHHLNIWHKSDFPEKYHWKNNRRIGPVIFFPEIHSIIEDLLPPSSDYKEKYPRSTHGYLNDDGEMNALFVAHGPVFKKGFTVKNFIENVDLYPLMCKILNVNPAPNNGSSVRVSHILND